MMCLRERPTSFGPSPIELRTLVARMTSSRNGLIASPVTSSDTPLEYTLAVSRKFPPAPTKRSTIFLVSSAPTSRPKVMHPRQSSETSTPVSPSRAYSIRPLLVPRRRRAPALLNYPYRQFLRGSEGLVAVPARHERFDEAGEECVPGSHRIHDLDRLGPLLPHPAAPVVKLCSQGPVRDCEPLQPSVPIEPSPCRRLHADHLRDELEFVASRLDDGRLFQPDPECGLDEVVLPEVHVQRRGPQTRAEEPLHGRQRAFVAPRERPVAEDIVVREGRGSFDEVPGGRSVDREAVIDAG